MLCDCDLSWTSLFRPAAEKRDLRTHANSKDADQSAHPHSLDRIFAVRLHNSGTVLKIYM